MGRIRKPLPGKLIISAIYSSLDVMHDAISEAEKKFSPVEFETDEMDFLHTKYYREEMGDDLKRKFFAFRTLIERDSLADIKILTNKIEDKFGEKVDDFVFRRVNLDPGILTPANLILASTKDYAHRIYLKNGIFAEVTLIYEKKRFRALPWTYPDYTEEEVIKFLERARNTIKAKDHDI